MLHNYRRSKRFPITGKATLTAGSKAITGRIVDISALGVALAVDDADETTLSGRKTWLCRIESDDLPAPVDFLVRVVRKNVWRHGLGLGCEITEIDNQPLVVLKAYRALALSRATPLIMKQSSGEATTASGQATPHPA